ncbi:hypothetical protein HK104_004308, partial [Borealophlyctis nickersoniae]
MSRKVNIEIVSDTICPWCFIGYRRLQSALQIAKQCSLPLDFSIKFKPFELDSTLPKEGVNKLERYESKFGKYESKFGKEQVDVMLKHMAKVGESVGINFSCNGLIANTADSHRLLEFALQKNKQLELVEELFKAHFERSKNVADINVLADAAQRVGLDCDEVIEYLESQYELHEVREQIEGAYRRRI